MFENNRWFAHQQFEGRLRAAQHHMYPTGGTLRGAFSSSLRGLKLIPAKWRYLIPPTSG